MQHARVGPYTVTNHPHANGTPAGTASSIMTTDAQWLERARRSAARRGSVEHVLLMPPHASTRRYARARFGDRSEVVMLLPDADTAPDEAGATRVERVADEPFVVAQRWLDGAGIRVPAVYDIDEDERALWLEDVGDTDFDAWVSRDDGNRLAAYRHAVALLVRWQQRVGDPSKAPSAVRERCFDRDILRWELDHYVQWRVEAQLERSLSTATRTALAHEFDALADALSRVPIRVMHRDMQSHNLMVGDDGELVVLDFQDAMCGPVVYDAVALLRDSYVVLSASELDELVAAWADGVSSVVDAPEERLVAWFHLQTVQRKLKDAGRFVFIDRVRGNPSFLRYIDDSLGYVRAALARGHGGPRLAELLADIDPALAPEA